MVPGPTCNFRRSPSQVNEVKRAVERLREIPQWQNLNAECVRDTGGEFAATNGALQLFASNDRRKAV